MKKLFFVFTTVFIIQICNAQTDYLYFGQTPPGNTAELFAPGIISLDDWEESFITFSPDGKECYFTKDDKSFNPWIMQTLYSDTGWTTPEKVTFISYNALSPSISPDGTMLFFSSAEGTEKMGVFQCHRTDSGWSEYEEVDSQISSREQESGCRLSEKDNYYVCSWRSGGKGGCDGWRIPYVDGQFQQAENLGFLNSSDGDCHWAPGPDEAYLVWNSRRPLTGMRGGFIETDLFISFAKPNGGWTGPRNLGSNVNSSSTEMGASFSHDGKYMFFSSDRRGTMDIYWVSTNFIDSLKNTNFPPYLNGKIPNQTINIDKLYDYQIPESTFIDDDGNNTLRYQASLAEGNSLPDWLSFDTITYKFSGTPDETAVYNIKVTAIDSAEENVSYTFRLTVEDNITNIENIQDDLPNESKLYQNYPNPSDYSTTIFFELAKPGNTELTIYDLAGQQLETILNEYKEEGIHQFIWQGEGYRKGIYYLCELQLSDETSGQTFLESTIKILLR